MPPLLTTFSLSISYWISFSTDPSVLLLLKIELRQLNATSRSGCALSLDRALRSSFSCYLRSLALSYFDIRELGSGECVGEFDWVWGEFDLVWRDSLDRRERSFSLISQDVYYRLIPEWVLIGSWSVTCVDNFLSLMRPLGSESISVSTIILSLSNLCLIASYLSCLTFCVEYSCCRLFCYSMTVIGG